MKNNKITIILFFLGFQIFVSAQNTPLPAVVGTPQDLEDVVYLKTGAIIRGIIIEQVPNKTLEIKSDDNNYFVFKMDEIAKITREKRITDPTDYKKKGFINITELGLGFGINTINTYHGSVDIAKQTNITGIRSINGYQMNEYFSFGLGVGFEAFLDGKNKGALMPLTVDVRMHYRKGKFSPLFNFNGGYSVGFDNSSGLIANPSIGLRLYLNKHIAYLFSIGYKVQQQRIFEKDEYGGLIPRIENFQFLQLNTGLSF